MENAPSESVLRLHGAVSCCLGCAKHVTTSEAALPWPAHDPPLCCFWKQHDGVAYLVTRHFSGWLEWKGAEASMAEIYGICHGKRVGKKIARAMVPVIHAYVGIAAGTSVELIT